MPPMPTQATGFMRDIQVYDGIPPLRPYTHPYDTCKGAATLRPYIIHGIIARG